MPLSEHEQRLFEEIEKSLADDPKFASAVKASDPRHHARRRLVLSGVVLLVGLGVLVAGAMTRNTLIGVIGFVVMLAAAVLGLQSQRRSSGSSRLRSVGPSGTAGASRRTGGRRPGRSSGRTSRPRGRRSLLDRLEERWHRRPEGNR